MILSNDESSFTTYWIRADNDNWSLSWIFGAIFDTILNSNGFNCRYYRWIRTSTGSTNRSGVQKKVPQGVPKPA